MDECMCDGTDILYGRDCDDYCEQELYKLMEDDDYDEDELGLEWGEEWIDDEDEDCIDFDCVEDWEDSDVGDLGEP